jgi:hypothetical protein
MGRGLALATRSLLTECVRVLEEEHPTGPRRVCYSLFGNQASNWTKKIGRLLCKARRLGLVPWAWIADDTRPEILPNVAESIENVRAYNRSVPALDPWLTQANKVVIWSEKSVGGTLQPVLDEFLLPFQIHHGNTSDTVLNSHVERMLRDRCGRHFVPLWVGDHDASGLDMGRDCIERLISLGLSPDDFTFERVAITREDVTALWEFRDPVKKTTKTKKGDPRTPGYIKATGLEYGVELEAMNTNVLRDRVRDAVKRYITDPAAWNRSMNASAVVQESWRAYADRWQPPILDVPTIYSDPRVEIVDDCAEDDDDAGR